MISVWIQMGLIVAFLLYAWWLTVDQSKPPLPLRIAKIIYATFQKGDTPDSQKPPPRIFSRGK